MEGDRLSTGVRLTDRELIMCSFLESASESVMRPEP
jgi:hypothetical protein